MIPIRRFATLIVMLVGLSACASVERLAIPSVGQHDPHWSKHDPNSSATVDHAAWQAFLDTYVRTDAAGVNRVAYARVTPTDRAALEAYLNRLSATDTTRLTRDEQLAFWINLYNAQTVAVVLDAYPVASIRAIKPHPLAIGPWNRRVRTVAGRALTLNDIEHRIVRALWDDPRIHYALNCAAVGCPNLALEAYRGATLEAALAEAERSFVNDPRGVRVTEDGRLVLSKIYNWYREDYGGNEPEILRRLARVAKPALARRLAGRSAVDRYDYDWALNAGR